MTAAAPDALEGRPVRLRLLRAKGFDLQELSRTINGRHAIVVARPTRWGNPHRWQSCPDEIGPPSWARGAAVEAFDEDLRAGRLRFTCDEAKAELEGANLACWCPADHCCHADVLLELANAPIRATVAEPRGGRDHG